MLHGERLAGISRTLIFKLAGWRETHAESGQFLYWTGATIVAGVLLPP